MGEEEGGQSIEVLRPEDWPLVRGEHGEAFVRVFWKGLEVDGRFLF